MVCHPFHIDKNTLKFFFNTNMDILKICFWNKFLTLGGQTENHTNMRIGAASNANSTLPHLSRSKDAGVNSLVEQIVLEAGKLCH